MDTEEEEGEGGGPDKSRNAKIACIQITMMRKIWPRTKRKSSDSDVKWNRPLYATSFPIFYSILIAAWMGVNEANGSDCPPPNKIRGCPCYNFDDGLILECAKASEESLKITLANVMSVSKAKEAVVQSLSIYELDQKVEELRPIVFPIGIKMRNLQISHSSIRELDDNAFERLAPSLESLGLTSGKLQQVPQKALAPLKRLNALDLEGNHIHDLPSYSFYGLSLIKLNLKSNEIGKISEYAFSGLEGTMKDLDLSENRIRIFPMTSLRRLEYLLSLKLASNEISSLPEDGFSRLDVVNYLDLSHNSFEQIPLNCFRCCPVLKTLSLYYNSVELVDKDAFISLIHLESIDLSHNRILFLDKATFRANQKLKTIDLSHNHLHYIKGIFARLPELKELFLSENNILEIASNTFSGSSNLLVLDLQHNAIKKLDSHGLSTLEKLAQLHLSNNFIDKLPNDFLNYCENLSTLSLDGNSIRDLEVGTFSKTKQLRELRLQDNQITEVRRGVFTPLPTLLELHLQNNAITDMETGALKSLHNLQHINLQGNLLAVLGDVFQLTNDPNHNGGSLVSIQLDNNGLGVLHNDSFRGQASVRIMWLGHNRLTRLQAPLFRDLLLVERLYLTNNSISRIEDNAFQPMQTLRFLELSMNRLTHVTGKTFSELRELEELHLQNNELRRIEPHALTALKRLRVLNLANNHLNILHSTIFQDGLPLRMLNLKNCSISVIEHGAFKGLNNLYEMNLENNRLETPTLDKIDIPGLRIIRLSYNNFTEITGTSLNSLPSLQQIWLEGSHIAELPFNTFSKNKNLAKVILTNNLLRTLPGSLFTGLESLREVKLDGNRFQEIPYEAFANSSTIEFLSIANNILLHIDASRFNGLTNLRELDLSGNYIMSLSGFAAANFSRLITINLSNNHLTALPNNFFIRANELRKIDLAGNKFRQIPDSALSGKNVPNLGWLNMTLNPLMRIREFSTETRYPSIEEMHISHTNLTIVTSQDFEAFSSLLHLFVSHNLIARVSPSAFRSLPKLLTLDLSWNELESLPQERLTGLEHLNLLNLTSNRLKMLEDFPEDLKVLRILDLSNNQITSIAKNTFQQLVDLDELHLFGNRIASIATDAFKALKKLHVLDVSRNLLEFIPLNAFRPLETQMRSLRADENPLHCGCESQELWEWLHDHQKLIRGSIERNRVNGIGMGIDEDETGMLRCDKPDELRGLIFLDLDPHAFCTAPLVLKIAIQDIQPFSVVVSWQSRNHTGLHGYQVAYHAIDRSDEIHGKLLDPNSRSVKLSKLSSNMQYLICVIGLGNWPSDTNERPSIGKFNSTNSEIFEANSLPEMIDSSTSLCTKVKTLETPRTIILTDGSAITDNSGVASVLTRRLGLIVGCCMGFVVFIILVSVLGYMKVKKQREAVKRDEQPVPPEYISYRHFSIQSGDANNTRNNNNNQANTAGFVNNIGQTTLNL